MPVTSTISHASKSEGPTNTRPEILDVRSGACNEFHKDGKGATYAQIIEGLSLPAGQKRMPTMLLYDERGLRLYQSSPATYLILAPLQQQRWFKPE